MAIVRWDPFRDFLTIQDEITKTFERFFGEGKAGTGLAKWAPLIDVFERDNEVVVRAEVPGLEAKDVEVNIDEEGLTIQGERKFEEEVKEENFYRLERRYGSFHRFVPFPVEVKPDKAKATFKNGVLEVVVPKAEPKKKPIRLKVEG